MRLNTLDTKQCMKMNVLHDLLEQNMLNKTGLLSLLFKVFFVQIRSFWHFMTEH